MGDPMTKILLTLAQQYAYIKTYRHAKNFNIPYIGTMVGDDLISLCTEREILKMHLKCLKDLGFMISDDDSYQS
jgi:hypothetical protein